MSLDTAIVLAGGRGTRMRARFPNIPKPLIPVAGKPFLLWQIEHLVHQGVRRIVLSIGHLGEAIETCLRRHPVDGVEIRFAREREPLGTGGAVRAAASTVDADRAFVLNGDSFCPAELSPLADLAGTTPCEAAILLSHVDDASEFGIVETDAQDNVISFVEKGSRPGGAWVNAGVYCFGVSWMRSLPSLVPLSMEEDVFPHVPRGRLRAVKTPRPFVDIGTPERLAQAEAFLTGQGSMQGRSR